MKAVAAMIVDRHDTGVALLWREALADPVHGDYDVRFPAGAPHRTAPLFRAPKIDADVVESEHVDYGLLVSFPDQSHSFVHGFEAGEAWQKMERGDVAELEFTTHVENREIIRRSADHLGWSVEVKDSGTPGWDYTSLKKVRPASIRTNPHGLRVVPTAPQGNGDDLNAPRNT